MSASPPTEPLKELPKVELSPNIPHNSLRQTLENYITYRSGGFVQSIEGVDSYFAGGVGKETAAQVLGNVMTAGINANFDNGTLSKDRDHLYDLDQKAKAWIDAFGKGVSYSGVHDERLVKFIADNRFSPDLTNAFLVGLQTRAILDPSSGYIRVDSRFPQFRDELHKPNSTVVAALTQLRDDASKIHRAGSRRDHLIEEELAEEGVFIPGALEHFSSSAERNMRRQVEVALEERDCLGHVGFDALKRNMAQNIFETIQRERLFPPSEVPPVDDIAARAEYFRKLQSAERGFVRGLRNNLQELDTDGKLREHEGWQKHAPLESLDWGIVTNISSNHRLPNSSSDNRLINTPEGERAFLIGALVRSVFQQESASNQVRYYKPEDIAARLRAMEGGEHLVNDIINVTMHSITQSGEVRVSDPLAVRVDRHLANLGKSLETAIKDQQRRSAEKTQGEAREIEAARSGLASIREESATLPTEASGVDAVRDFMEQVGDPTKLTPEQREQLARWLGSSDSQGKS